MTVPLSTDSKHNNQSSVWVVYSLGPIDTPFLSIVAPYNQHNRSKITVALYLLLVFAKWSGASSTLKWVVRLKLDLK